MPTTLLAGLVVLILQVTPGKSTAPELLMGEGCRRYLCIDLAGYKLLHDKFVTKNRSEFNRYETLLWGGGQASTSMALNLTHWQ